MSTYKRKFTPVGAQELYDAAQQASMDLHPARSALTGGYAMTAYGSPRLTGDVDLIAETGPFHPKGKSALGPLAFGGFSYWCNGVQTDVIVRSDPWAPLYAAALRTARRKRGYPIPVVQPSYLIATKMVARRDKDHSDVMFLLGHVVRSKKDRAHARQVVMKFLGQYAGEEFDHLVQEADWRRKTGR